MGEREEQQASKRVGEDEKTIESETVLHGATGVPCAWMQWVGMVVGTYEPHRMRLTGPLTVLDPVWMCTPMSWSFPGSVASKFKLASTKMIRLDGDGVGAGVPPAKCRGNGGDWAVTDWDAERAARNSAVQESFMGSDDWWVGGRAGGRLNLTS